MKTKVRDSNYELLRIISMFFIVLYHIILHGRLLSNTIGVSNFVFRIITLFIIVHVNCFMLITGYYQSKSTFKFKNLFSIIIQIAFYNLVINSVLKLSGLVEYSNDEFLSRILFYNYESYWFIKCYIIIYILSPFLNKLISNLDRIQFKKLLLCLFCCFSLFPFLTGNLFYDTNGLTLIQYISLYFVGAYISKYKLSKSIFKKINLSQKRLLYIVIFVTCWIINISLFSLQEYIGNLDSNILNRISISIVNYIQRYNNPFIILQSIAVFLYFGTFKFKNKLINKISPLMLGIYFIHESRILKNNLYSWIGIDVGTMIYGKMIILKAFTWAIILFIICLTIELIRKTVFKYLSKLKIVDKLSKNIEMWISNITEIK